MNIALDNAVIQQTWSGSCGAICHDPRGDRIWLIDRQGEETLIPSPFRSCKAIATGLGVGPHEQP
ncbi:hypothetical protein [Oscillatoria sp. HE19RPO]|uniref:hypothetical protein n=1 Tax=Oscillatoria sp. HE19RPO TaxID=2954806 RepID=UPI0020C3579F|nr:hypothetical protein [Oscillatoria sp. HE19RPO]